jgi:hypothetical protein
VSVEKRVGSVWEEQLIDIVYCCIGGRRRSLSMGELLSHCSMCKLKSSTWQLYKRMSCGFNSTVEVAGRRGVVLCAWSPYRFRGCNCDSAQDSQHFGICLLPRMTSYRKPAPLSRAISDRFRDFGTVDRHDLTASCSANLDAFCLRRCHPRGSSVRVRCSRLAWLLRFGC